MTAVLDPKLNFAVVTTSTGYAAGAVSVVLSTGHGGRLPAPSTDGAFNLTWWNSTDYATPAEDPYAEVVRVTARSSDTLTITRAQESTTASAKNTAGKTYSMVLGLTAKDWTDLDNLARAGRELLTAGGTANALTATPTTAWTSYTAGRQLLVTPASANTGSATLNVSSLGVKTLKGRGGAALQAGDLKAGVPALVVYDGTDFLLLSAEVDPRQVAKAWVRFSHVAGVPTAQESFNVTSLTDNGTGDVTINFTTAFAAATFGYAAHGSAGGVSTTTTVTATTTTTARVTFYSNVPQDTDYASALFFGAR